MDPNIAIKVENLSKIYKLYNAPIDRMKEALNPFKKKYHKDFHALDDVSFNIPKGECVGVMGKNGAGKSTILKIITGVLTPTSGKVEVNGRISALLELGGGFNPEYTGIENIYFQGNIMGFQREDMDSKLKDILDFADIGDFIHQPVKNYSSGMFARLAFALAINIEPEILIVDEALSVGDMFFQTKCMARMKKLIENEHTTVLFVSHDISSIKAMCTSAVLLENGRVKMYGRADEVAEEYFASRFDGASGNRQQRVEEDLDNTLQGSPKQTLSLQFSDEAFIKTSSFQRIQNGKANFTNVILLNGESKQIQEVEFGQTVTIRCFVKSHDNIHNLSFGFHVRDRNGVEILYDDTVLQRHDILWTKPDDEYVIDWTFKVLLQPNQYTIAVVASIPINLAVSEVDMCDFVPIALQFTVSSKDENLYSAVFANSSLRIEKMK